MTHNIESLLLLISCFSLLENASVEVLSSHQWNRRDDGQKCHFGICLQLAIIWMTVDRNTLARLNTIRSIHPFHSLFDSYSISSIMMLCPFELRYGQLRLRHSIIVYRITRRTCKDYKLHLLVCAFLGSKMLDLLKPTNYINLEVNHEPPKPWFQLPTISGFRAPDTFHIITQIVS